VSGDEHLNAIVNRGNFRFGHGLEVLNDITMPLQLVVVLHFVARLDFRARHLQAAGLARAGPVPVRPVTALSLNRAWTLCASLVGAWRLPPQQPPLGRVGELPPPVRHHPCCGSLPPRDLPPLWVKLELRPVANNLLGAIRQWLSHTTHNRPVLVVNLAVSGTSGFTPPTNASASVRSEAEAIAAKCLWLGRTRVSNFVQGTATGQSEFHESQPAVKVPKDVQRSGCLWEESRATLVKYTKNA
jgi:hypothetical protein